MKYCEVHIKIVKDIIEFWSSFLYRCVQKTVISIKLLTIFRPYSGACRGSDLPVCLGAVTTHIARALPAAAAAATDRYLQVLQAGGNIFRACSH